MTRIEFTDTDSSNSYTVPYNPVAVTLRQNVVRDVVSDIASVPIIRTATVDNRVRTMVWGNFEASDSNFNSMVVTLKSYVGRTKLLNLHDIDYNSLGAKTIQIINVRKVILNSQRSSTRYGLAVDFIYKVDIITESLPSLDITLEDLSAAISATGPKTYSIVADNASYVEYGSRAPSYPNGVTKLIDLTGNNWYWQDDNSSVPPNIKTDLAGINGRAVIESGAIMSPPGTEMILSLDHVDGYSWQEYDFLANTTTGGATIMIMVNMHDLGGVGFDPMVVMQSFSGDTGSGNGFLIRVNWDDGNIWFAHGRQGGGTANWYHNSGNSQLTGAATDDAWIVLVWRTDYNTTPFWEFQDSVSNRIESGAPDLAYDATGTLNTHLQLFHHNSNTYDQFKGYFTLVSIWDKMISNSEYDSILTAINAYYNKSFVRQT